MARSYFTRMIRGGEGAPLVPPRPVSNLWKSAQIENAAALPLAGPSPARVRPTPQSSYIGDPAASTVQLPARAKVEIGEVEVRPVPQSGTDDPMQEPPSARILQLPISGETQPDMPVAAPSTRGDRGRQDSGDRPRHGQSGMALQHEGLPVQGAASPVAGDSSGARTFLQRPPESAVSFAPISSRRGSPQIPPAPFDGTPVGEKHVAKARVSDAGASPVRSALQPARPVMAVVEGQPMPASSTQHHAADATKPFPSHASSSATSPAPSTAGQTRERQTHLLPADLPAPVRSRTPSPAMRHSSASEAPRARASSVHIGRIEVQVVPPATPSYRLAPPAPPKGRLARGYSLWQGW